MMSKLKNVLVVEDDSKTVVYLSKSLKKSGLKVDVAKSRQEAIERIKLKQYDAAIIDINLGDRELSGSGMEVIKYLKSKNVDTLIIVLTGHASTETAIASVNLGVDKYLIKGEKPYQDYISDLLDLLRLKEKSTFLASNGNIEKPGNLPVEIEDYIDDTLKTSFNENLSSFFYFIENRKYQEASNIAGALYDLCKNIMSHLNYEQQRNIYQKVAALSAYWKLNRDLYASRRDL